MIAVIGQRGSSRRRTARSAQGEPVAINGAEIVAQAMRQIDPDVVAAYPITPQTILTEAFSQFVADGVVHSEFIAVESEHAAMSACIGAAAAGARAQTATSGPGLALMWEVLWVASGMRLPIVMHLCTRALSAPLSILCDHSDAMGMRDSGWIMLFGENVQEAYDNALQAVRIAEHPVVRLPVANVQDGFFVTHALERAEILPDDVVKAFVGEYRPDHYLLDFAHPLTLGAWDYRDYYFEHKRQQAEAMERALAVVEAVGEEYGKLTGRRYGLLEGYRLKDARLVVVAMGMAVGPLRTVVDQLRRRGVRAGLLKVRSYRPFPGEALVQALVRAEAVAVLDRAISFGGAGNPLFMDVCTALAGRLPGLPLVNYVYGLGGRDILPEQLQTVYADLETIAAAGRVVGPMIRYLGLREGESKSWR